MKFDQESYDNFLISKDVIGFFKEPIRLKSGRMSPWYANLRNLTDNTATKNIIIRYILDFVEDLKISPDLFYGVPEGATKLGLFLSDEYAKRTGKKVNLVMGRGKPKDHGQLKDRLFIGQFPEKAKVVVVEDVTTTGGSLISTIETLKQLEINIIAAIGLVNRMEIRDDGKSVKEKIEEDLGIKYFYLGDSKKLLMIAEEKYKPEEKIKNQVREYFEKYGAKE
jgi:orotate phosphoribosyltransferase